MAITFTLTGGTYTVTLAPTEEGVETAVKTTEFTVTADTSKAITFEGIDCDATITIAKAGESLTLGTGTWGANTKVYADETLVTGSDTTAKAGTTYAVPQGSKLWITDGTLTAEELDRTYVVNYTTAASADEYIYGTVVNGGTAAAPAYYLEIEKMPETLTINLGASKTIKDPDTSADLKRVYSISYDKETFTVTPSNTTSVIKTTEDAYYFTATSLSFTVSSGTGTSGKSFIVADKDVVEAETAKGATSGGSATAQNTATYSFTTADDGKWIKPVAQLTIKTGVTVAYDDDNDAKTKDETLAGGDGIEAVRVGKNDTPAGWTDTAKNTWALVSSGDYVIAASDLYLSATLAANGGTKVAAFGSDESVIGYVQSDATKNYADTTAPATGAAAAVNANVDLSLKAASKVTATGTLKWNSVNATSEKYFAVGTTLTYTMNDSSKQANLKGTPAGAELTAGTGGNWTLVVGGGDIEIEEVTNTVSAKYSVTGGSVKWSRPLAGPTVTVPLCKAPWWCYCTA